MIAFSTDWTLAGDNTFIMGFLPFDQVERVTRFAAKNGLNNIGLITANDNYGRVVADAFGQIAPRFGIQTTARASINPKSLNLSKDVQNFISSAPAANANKPFDAVLMPLGGQQATSVANFLSKYNLPPSAVKRIGTGLLDDINLAKEPALNGAWFAAPSPNTRRSFENKYMAAYGRSAPRLSTLAYDATALAAVLSRKTDINLKSRFDKRAISNPNGFLGLDGIFRFRPDGTVERGLAILEFRNGRITILDPAPKTFQR